MRKNYQGRDLLREKTRICSKCIYDSTISGISFNKDGICNFCEQIDLLKSQYGTGEQKGQETFQRLIKSIKEAGKSKKYDVAIGVSGGTDSSYLLVLAKKYGLRPLAVHYDNTWDTSTATQNIKRVTTVLKIDLYTYVCNNTEANDIFRSFLMAGVPELDAATDLAITEVLYQAASKYGISYILEGHSFLEEGIAPMGKSYFDGKYIKAIHKIYGHQRMLSYPNMSFSKFLYWSIFHRIKRIRPYWYIKYSKDHAKEYLRERFDWIDYGGHHLENRLTAFHHSFYNPIKFGLDQRNNSLSALARSGSLTREEALARYSEPPYMDKDLLNYLLKRLDLSDDQFWEIMNKPKRYFTDYPTYKKRFEFYRPIFYILAKANLVPMSFYLKYCFPHKNCTE